MSFKFAAAVCGAAMGIALTVGVTLADPAATASPAGLRRSRLLRLRRSIRKPTNFWTRPARRWARPTHTAFTRR